MVRDYQELMKPCRLSTVVTGFLHLTWHRGTSNIVMEESNIKKTAFRVGLTHLYEFTCMPFGLLNGAHHLMEQCLGNQKFVTLLQYLNDIYIFVPTIDDMLD